MVQRNFPVYLASLVGVFMVVQFFVPHPAMTRGYNLVLDWKQVVLGCTFILGVLSLLRFHVRKMARSGADAFYSGVVIISCAATIGAAIFFGSETGPYTWLYDRVQAPMQATMFSLLAYFVASAAYRAFRARSLHATLLLVAGAIVMIGRVPIGELIGIDVGGQRLSLAALANWILDTPNVAAKRGILIGVGLGMIATSLRIILGIEQGYLGRARGPAEGSR